MKFSELWLREWINIALDSESLSNQMTLSGLEVESISPVAEAFHGVVVGEVVECNQYQNFNNLRVTKVNIGSARPLNIICNAINCRQGLKVAIATVGAVLPGNFKIKKIKLHGRFSEGMLCSYSELGMSSNNSSIIELPEEAPIGTDIREYLKLNDNTIAVNVTSNRADCLSIIGLARDLSALNKTKLSVPDIPPVVATIQDTIPIQVKATVACPRYLGRIVRNINAKSLTPIWMKEKLRRCGICSINAVVDVTNYVLLELGQPIEVFDKDRIDIGIIVRMANEGETLILLDGNKVKLHADTLVIADYSKALAMGGILGGEYSSVSSETHNLILTCSFFNPLSIIGRARQYGLHTYASHRYERGVDSELQYKAMERATRLLIDICKGDPGPIIDITNKKKLPKRARITLRRRKLDRLIGHYIDNIQIIDILSRLGCNIIQQNKDKWQILAPSWRFDIKIEEDLVEEITRIYGYRNIPNEPIKANLIVNSYKETHLSLKRVKTLLNDKGYQEVITYSFVDPKLQQLINPGEKALILPSPASSAMSAMRLSLWTGLLKTILYNQNHQQSSIRIFETGLCFVPDIYANLGIRQEAMLAGAIYGNFYKEHWDLEKRSVDFYDLKGDLESILDLTGKLSEIKFCAESIPTLHPGQSAAIYLEGKRIGFIGALHPELERKLDLNSHTIIFELEWNKISNCIVPQAQYISCCPINRRDIAIVVDENLPAGDILEEFKKVGLNQIVDVNLFDIYRGQGVAEGFKSLAISLILQDPNNRTLEEAEIVCIINKCIEALKKRFQVSLRNEIHDAYKN